MCREKPGVLQPRGHAPADAGAAAIRQALAVDPQMPAADFDAVTGNRDDSLDQADSIFRRVEDHDLSGLRRLALDQHDL